METQKSVLLDAITKALLTTAQEGMEPREHAWVALHYLAGLAELTPPELFKLAGWCDCGDNRCKEGRR